MRSEIQVRLHACRDLSVTHLVLLEVDLLSEVEGRRAELDGALLADRAAHLLKGERGEMGSKMGA